MSKDTVQEIVDELGFGVIPNIFAHAKSTDIQTALWKAFRHVVLRGVLPRTVKEMMGVISSQSRGSRYAAEIHLHALMVQGIRYVVAKFCRRCPLVFRHYSVLLNLLLLYPPLFSLKISVQRV